MNTQYKVGDHVLIKGEIVDEYPDWGDYRVKITRADGDYNEIDLTPELFNNSIEASLRERAEKAEAIVRGMFPMWINAMAYCEHGKKDQLLAMRNYYNGRENPLTSDDIHLMFSLIPDKEE